MMDLAGPIRSGVTPMTEQERRHRSGRPRRRRARQADARRPLRRPGRRDRRGHHDPPRPRLGPDRVLADALVEGMRIVGIDFRDGILFVPEVLLSANAMKAGMEILRPLLAETGAEPVGQGRHRHRQGRHPRHRQEPGGDDDGGRRLRGDRHRHQLRRRQVPRRAGRAPARHPRHVGAAHDDDAVHEGRHRHVARARACATTTSCSSAGRR